MKDFEKRRRVMERSRRLGHCICDAKKPCPCDVFKAQDVCLCAGERAAAAAGPVRLTRLVENAGCASKIDQAALKGILSQLPAVEDPRVLIGAAAGDDAGVFMLTEDVAIVQTVDVFCPSVDDPYTFGQIAAANSVSDIYAMGGTPLTALSIVGFPIRTVPDECLVEILKGGLDKMTEAGVSVIGGHSIKDAEMKAGFAVTGVVDVKRIMANSGAREGDTLVLTKPIGTGIVAFAAQIGRAPEGAMEAAAESMKALNRVASELMVEHDAHACTDITGFGLMGHLAEMARASGVDAEVVWDDVPLLPGVLELAQEGVLPGGIERNRESCESRVEAGEGLSREMMDILFDAQTSGGLLVSLPEERAEAYISALRRAGVGAAVIGRVTEGRGRVRVRTTGAREFVAAPGAEAPLQASMAGDASCCAGGAAGVERAAEKDEACCADAEAGAADGAKAGGAAATEAAFKSFMARANAPGALDAATKQALAIALSIVTKCEPCTKAHIEKARKMGFSQEEIDEAAWMAVAFGGSPVMMFYNGVKQHGRR